MIYVTEKDNNSFNFCVKTKNNTVLFKSSDFSTKKELRSTIGILGSLVQKQNAFERKTNYNGKFHFNIKNKEGWVIGSSQLYNSEIGMDNGIKNLKKNILELSDKNLL